jgi:hypothetical protein
MLSTKTRRVSSGLTTPSGRMIEELQIEVVNQKSSSDRAREELRLSQRVIGQVCQLSLCYAANASYKFEVEDKRKEG